jgi:uncharacterized protein
MRHWMAWVVCWLALALAAQAARPMKWESLMLVKAAAEKGDHEAQFLLGLQYKVGDGLPRDRAEATKWLRRAAESGHADAQYALGDLLAEPAEDGAAGDQGEAMKWWQAAAAQGQPEAKARLAPLLAQAQADAQAGKPDPAARTHPGSPPDKSREMDEDPAETVRWSLLLSGLRGAEALLVRGFVLENGVMVNRDLAAAAESYRKAAKLGDARAEYQLSLMYAEGRGVAQDSAEADRWRRLAASHGSAEAKAALAKPRTAPPTEPAAPAGQLPGRENAVPHTKP